MMTDRQREPIISIVGWPAFHKRDSNPYTELLYTAIGGLGVEVRDFRSTGWRTLDCDLIHVHWPEYVLGNRALPLAAWLTLKLLWTLAVLRRRGIRVVWTAHNMEQHERGHWALTRLYWSLFPRQVDGIISLSQSHVGLLKKRIGRREVPITVIRHGHYRGAYPDTISPAEARISLELEENALVIGWVGTLREYKNVDGLVTAFCEVAQRRWRLLLAGRSQEKSLHQRLLNSAQHDPRVRYHPGWVPRQQMERYLKAANVVVLPYHTIWNSGAALLALSFNVPVVLPRSPSMLELRAEVGDEWVYLYDGPFSGYILRDCVDWLCQRRRSSAPDIDNLTWESIAAKTVTFYEQVLRI